MVNPILAAKLAPIAEAQSRCQVRRSQSLVWLGAALVGVVLLSLRFQADFSVSLAHLLLLAAGALGGSFLVRVRARSRGADLHAVARQIEREHPDLHVLLLTAMDAAPDARSGDFHYLQKRVIREALAKNFRSPWDQRGRERLLFSQFFYGLSVVVFAAVAVALGFGGIRAPAQGVVAGHVEVRPGNAVIERGSSVVSRRLFAKRFPARRRWLFFRRMAALGVCRWRGIWRIRFLGIVWRLWRRRLCIMWNMAKSGRSSIGWRCLSIRLWCGRTLRWIIRTTRRYRIV